jgi:hypothetical protein
LYGLHGRARVYQLIAVGIGWAMGMARQQQRQRLSDQFSVDQFSSFQEMATEAPASLRRDNKQRTCGWQERRQQGRNKTVYT